MMSWLVPVISSRLSTSQHHLTAHISQSTGLFYLTPQHLVPHLCSTAHHPQTGTDVRSVFSCEKLPRMLVGSDAGHWVWLDTFLGLNTKCESKLSSLLGDQRGGEMDRDRGKLTLDLPKVIIAPPTDSQWLVETLQSEGISGIIRPFFRKLQKEKNWNRIFKFHLMSGGFYVFQVILSWFSLIRLL